VRVTQHNSTIGKCNGNIKVGVIEIEYKYPCGGGVEYLHRDPASRKRRRNGTKKCRAIA
jgi:hypothetical protein